MMNTIKPEALPPVDTFVVWTRDREGNFHWTTKRTLRSARRTFDRAADALPEAGFIRVEDKHHKIGLMV